MEQIRNVRPGDEDSLAYVQTESWKAAFREIVPADILAECTRWNRLPQSIVGFWMKGSGTVTLWNWMANRTASLGGALRGTQTWRAVPSDLPSFPSGKLAQGIRSSNDGTCACRCQKSRI